ncbi:MAG TPA: transglycosylase SLT domain-containing protein [Arenimonas sp.]|nr:transglycosylase SLT domain-containing protein [Arenimonas sp.]
MPDKPSSTPPIVSPVVEPENTTQPVPDEIINMVEAHVVDTPVVSDGMNKRLGSTVFARLKNDFSGPICNDNAAINQWKKRYAGNPRAFSNHLGEILPLLDYVSSEVERRKLPAEFALIPIIESWYQPHAVGAGGPSGMWQMIGTTAKNHGIKIQADYDGRFSVVDSTDAALSYLGTLQGMFKDWQRAVMGYNAGEFRVLRAIRSSGNKSEGQDHWPHGLSPITYAYIAKLQALSCLISQPEKNNLSLPEAREFTPLAAILVEADSGSLDSIAKRHQLDAEILKRNNPAYRRGQISIHAPRRILMPAYLAAGSVANLVNTEAQNSQTTSSGSAEKTTLEASTGSHEIKSGDTLWSIAKRYGISITSLRKLNGLGRNPVLRVGQILKLAP